MRLYSIPGRPETTLCVTHLDGNFAQFGTFDKFSKTIGGPDVSCQYCGATTDTPDGLADRILDTIDHERAQAGLRLVNDLLQDHEQLEWEQHKGSWVVVFDDPTRRGEAYLGLTLLGAYPDRETAERRVVRHKEDLNRGFTDDTDVPFEVYCMPLFQDDAEEFE